MPLAKSINMYGFDSICSIAFTPNKSYIFFACSAPSPNFSKNPTICHTSQFSIKLCAISIALFSEIPLISANFSGLNLNIFMVSSPNFFFIFLAVASPIPLIVPFDKYLSNAPNVSGISFSNVSTLNCLPYSLCSTNLPVTFNVSPDFTNGKYPTTVVSSSSVSNTAIV